VLHIDELLYFRNIIVYIMNTLIVFILVILLLFAGGIILSHCCITFFNNKESYKQYSPNTVVNLNDYLTPTPDEEDAELYRRGWIDPADSLEEEGGSYAQDVGIEPAKELTADPWMSKMSYL
jgi:hypothetical protein